MKTYLPISYSDRPALAEDEMLDQTEIDAIIEREQREADAFAAKQGAKHGDHDQSTHGGGRGGGDLETSGLGNTAISEGGFSISLAGDNPKTGWMVSQAGTERSFSIESLSMEGQMGDEPIEGDPWRDNVKAEVDRFVAEEIGELRGPGTFLGGWVDGGRLYLDVSHNIQDRGEAVEYAKENGQLAMYNAETGEYQRFDEEVQPRAASRGPGEPKKEKVYLEVTEDTDTDELTDRLLAALFKS